MTKRDPQPIVNVTIPVCPRDGCGSTDLKSLSGKRDNGDGTWTRPMMCKACRQRFKAVIELATEFN